MRTHLTTRLRPVDTKISQICDSDFAVPEEAWQLFISILQAVRDEPFNSLSLFAQNPLGGLECLHLILSEDGLNQTKRLSYC